MQQHQKEIPLEILATALPLLPLEGFLNIIYHVPSFNSTTPSSSLATASASDSILATGYV